MMCDANTSSIYVESSDTNTCTPTLFCYSMSSAQETATPMTTEADILCAVLATHLDWFTSLNTEDCNIQNSW
jgi:hypothetical protein